MENTGTIDSAENKQPVAIDRWDQGEYAGHRHLLQTLFDATVAWNDQVMKDRSRFAGDALFGFDNGCDVYSKLLRDFIKDQMTKQEELFRKANHIPEP